MFDELPGAFDLLETRLYDIKPEVRHELSNRPLEIGQHLASITPAGSVTHLSAFKDRDAVLCI